MKKLFFFNKSRFSIVFILFSLFFNIHYIFSYSLVMKNNVKISNAEVCFHDIFQIKGKIEFIDKSTLKNLCFFSTPSKIVKVNYDDLEIKLIEENIIPDKVYKKQTKIIPILRIISKKEIMKNIISLIKIDNNNSIQAKIKNLSIMNKIFIPKDVKMKYFIRNKKYPGSKKLMIQILSSDDSNRVVKNIIISFQLIFEVKVYYSNQRLKRKSKLNSRKVYSKIVQVINRFQYRKLRVRYLLKNQSLVGGILEAKKQIQKDRILYKTDFYHKTVIKRGDLLNVIYSKGGLYIKIEAKAKEKGNIGDIIQVANKRKKFNVQIVSSRKAIFKGMKN